MYVQTAIRSVQLRDVEANATQSQRLRILVREHYACAASGTGNLQHLRRKVDNEKVARAIQISDDYVKTLQQQGRSPRPRYRNL